MNGECLICKKIFVDGDLYHDIAMPTLDSYECGYCCHDCFPYYREKINPIIKSDDLEEMEILE